ncbi:MAG: TonB-dependent receptor [Myxococcales bacterium]|nr:TonB-dependent receptor [Myxococcales bacterium]
MAWSGAPAAADPPEPEGTSSEDQVAEPDAEAPEIETETEAQDQPLEAHATVAVEKSAANAREAHSVVRRPQMQERLPHSTPDALRFEPGVSVQRSAHGQASVYVRGMTGQQVTHVYDGVRMNNGTYRQGPNQYFFVVDSQTLSRIEVVRGSASTAYGSDALGGAVLAFPREPLVDPKMRLSLRPRISGRYGSADNERGGRAEVEAVLAGSTGVLAGIGYRDLDRLESGGVVKNPGRAQPLVPRFEADGRTQLGTGFRELTFDTRISRRLRPTLTWTTALYGFREYDSPRTDQCPPPEAPVGDGCLIVKEQFRTLLYTALRGNAGEVLRDLDMNVSLQRHDEGRVRDRNRAPSYVLNRFDNRVDTLGASVRARTRRFERELVDWQLGYGAEAYHDEVVSSAQQRFTDPILAAELGEEALRFEQSRGQYLSGSKYTSAAVFGELELWPSPWLSLQGGGRLSAVGASSPAEPISRSMAVSQQWGTAVGRTGVELKPLTDLRVELNYDQGFRAPNLDDLTSRQQVGSGFQFENSELRPERTDSFELGLLATPGWLQIEGWLFATFLHDGITRAVREQDDCPPETDACRASRSQFQLINAEGTALIWGSDGAITAKLPAGFALRATYNYAWGQAPNTGSRSTAGKTPFGERVPISRIPPLGGSVEARYRHLASGFYTAAAMVWARAQRRLAPADLHDARIPDGGTPGYAVFDLRAGLRPSPHWKLSVVFENVFDAAYRIHGSSVNGGGRGLLAEVSLGY